MTEFDVEAFHRRAVETPSHEGIGEMREVLVSTLAEHGQEAAVDGAGNVVAERGPDEEDETHVVLNTHIDTVPPHVEYEDAGAEIRGRGACDAKGPLAAFVAAFLRADVDGRLTLAVTPDEETTQTGAGHLRETLSADAYIVGEPTGLDVCTAARGQFEGRVWIHGESAHAASGEGANAVRAAAPILQAMESYDEERGPGAHDRLGRPRLTATMIDGGEASNQVPADCAITFDRRSVPPETVAGFREGLAEHLREWLPDSMGLAVELANPDTPSPEAFATDEDSAVVDALLAAGAGATRPFGAATEASYFAADAPTVVFGPGVLADEAGAVAHSDREYVPREQLHDAARICRRALERLA